MATFRASITALEVTVAPESTSMPSPTTKGPFLPMNWLMKASSVAQRVPKPEVSSAEPMLRAAMVPSSFRVTDTFTSLWKPWAVPMILSAGAGSAPGAANSPEVTLPSSTVRFTFISPVKPSAGATTAAPSAFTPTVPFSPSARMVTGASAAPTLARAALAASTTAVEVTVAPDRASMFSPRVRGAALPIN